MHRGTWSPAGVILQVPEDNIIAAKPEDMGSISNERIQRLYRRPENAARLLRQTGPSVYNEAIVSGTSPDSGQKTEFSGAFIMTDPKTGKPMDDALAEQARRFAEARKLPIIEIEAPVK